MQTNTAYLAAGLRTRARQLLARATGGALALSSALALTATAYRALARAAQLLGDVSGWRVHARLAARYAHQSELCDKNHLTLRASGKHNAYIATELIK